MFHKNYLKNFAMFLALAILVSNFSYAVPFTANNQIKVSQTTVSTKVLNADNYRKYLLVINRGSSDVYLKIGSEHSSDEGVIISAGGNYEPSSVPVGSIYLKSASGTNTVNIVDGY